MKKTGTIESLNVSPKGFYEGLLLRTSKGIIQINLPKDDADASAKSWNPGEKVTLEVEPDEPHGEPAHEVFKLVRPLNTKGEQSGNDKLASRHFSGQVAKLNYALHGEVNGGILNSGDFLHLKPEGARALKLKVGMKVEGRGNTRPMVGGFSVIEAEEVNGVGIRHKKAKKKHAKH